MKRQTVWWIPGSGTWGRRGRKKEAIRREQEVLWTRLTFATGRGHFSFCSRGGSKIYVSPRSQVVGSTIGTVDTWGRRPHQWANDGLFPNCWTGWWGPTYLPFVIGGLWALIGLFVWGWLVLETSCKGPKAHRWWEKKSAWRKLAKLEVDKFQPSHQVTE
jgi:hypothetical protein